MAIVNAIASECLNTSRGIAIAQAIPLIMGVFFLSSNQVSAINLRATNGKIKKSNAPLTPVLRV